MQLNKHVTKNHTKTNAVSTLGQNQKKFSRYCVWLENMPNTVSKFFSCNFITTIGSPKSERIVFPYIVRIQLIKIERKKEPLIKNSRIAKSLQLTNYWLTY